MAPNWENAMARWLSVGRPAGTPRSRLRTCPIVFGLGVAAFLVLQPTASANAVYLAQTAAAGASGSSCGSAFAYTYFNTSSNWTSGTPSGTQIGPGTTVHLCGTITAAPGSSNFLVFQGGGTSGNTLTLLFEPNAVLQATYWSGNAIFSTGNSYITVNGGTNGIIQATNNGMASLGYANQQDNGNGVLLATGSYMTVQNLTVQNMYVRACTEPIGNCTDSSGGNTGGAAVENGSNLTIANSTCHDLHWCFGYSDAYGTGAQGNIYIYGNTVYHMDHGIFGDLSNASATASNIFIHDNIIHDAQPWDSAQNYYHHDGIHVYNYGTSGVTTNVQVYNNYIYGDWGAGVNAWIFLEGDSGNSHWTGPEVYNNVLVDQSSVAHAGNGFISTDGAAPIIVSNTIIGSTSVGSGGVLIDGAGATFMNNTLQATTPAVTLSSYYGGTIASGKGDDNNYYNVTTWNNEAFAAWQASCSCDSHSQQNSNPNLSSSYQPNSGSPLIKAGFNLSGLGISALDSDKSGAQRPASGAGNWDIGAYQSATVQVQMPQPPPSATTTVN